MFQVSGGLRAGRAVIPKLGLSTPNDDVRQPDRRAHAVNYPRFASEPGQFRSGIGFSC